MTVLLALAILLATSELISRMTPLGSLFGWLLRHAMIKCKKNKRRWPIKIALRKGENLTSYYRDTPDSLHIKVPTILKIEKNDNPEAKVEKSELLITVGWKVI